MTSLWQSLWQAAAIVLSAGFSAVACYATGVLALYYCGLHERLRRAEYAPLAFVLGASFLHLEVFAILTLHLAYKPVLVIMLAVPIAMTIPNRLWRPPASRDTPLSPGLRIVFGLCFAVYCVFYFVNAL